MDIQVLSQLGDKTQEFLGGRGAMSTKLGLVKEVNEDAIGCRTEEDGTLRISIADGHWGQEAAVECVEYWLNNPIDTNPLQSMRWLEATLAKRFAVPLPDAETTRTPEASTLTITIHPDGRMNVVGYGDCRLSVVRDGRVMYRYNTLASWIGLFSSLGLRDRVPVDSGTVVESLPLLAGDTILLYTDGVDECVYETPTLDVESFAASDNAPVQICEEIMRAVFECGAEDNATMAIFTVQ